jgi:DNA processing protein
VVIVSGGARGVDGAAHAAALVARRPTVAVLGCGVDVPYPREHRPLYDRIEEDGAVVSEHPCGTQPRPHHFPIRNRILAGWSRAVLIPEGSVESGSLITARLALEAGREVLAVPGPITSRLSEGPNALIAEGARLVRGPADVLAELGLAAEPAPAAPADPVLALLPPGEALDLDALVERSGRPASELLALLGGLEARGQAFGLPGGRWLRAGPS